VFGSTEIDTLFAVVHESYAKYFRCRGTRKQSYQCCHVTKNIDLIFFVCYPLNIKTLRKAQKYMPL